MPIESENPRPTPTESRKDKAGDTRDADVSRPRIGASHWTMRAAAPEPAASMSRVPGMPSSRIARASSARISAAVKIGRTAQRGGGSRSAADWMRKSARTVVYASR